MPKRPNKFLQELFPISRDHGAITANGSIKLTKVAAGRKLRVDRVLYINPAGLAGDATNAFRLEIKNGATVVATICNTDTDDVPAGASLPADTFVEGVVAAGTAAVLQAGEILDITFTEDGTATLPAGHIQIQARLI